MSQRGTRLTLAVFPHRWDEQTFSQARGTTELDPLRTILWLGHMPDKVPDPIGTKLHKSVSRHRFLCRQVQGFAALCVIAPSVGEMLRLKYGGCPATGRCGGSYDCLAWSGASAPAPHPGGQRPGKRAHLGLSLAM